MRSAHDWTRSRTVGGISSSLGMATAEAPRNQRFHRPIEQLAARVSKQQLGARVDEDDATLAVDDDHGVGSRFEERP